MSLGGGGGAVGGNAVLVGAAVGLAVGLRVAVAVAVAVAVRVDVRVGAMVRVDVGVGVFGMGVNVAVSVGAISIVMAIVGRCVASGVHVGEGAEAGTLQPTREMRPIRMRRFIVIYLKNESLKMTGLPSILSTHQGTSSPVLSGLRTEI